MSALAALAQRLGLRVDSAWRQAARGLQPCLLHVRRYGFSTVEQNQAEIDSINDLFVEARDEIEMAREDAETVYFNESCETARKAVDTVIGRYQGLLAQLSEGERGKLQRSMGLKMEQLKGELQQLDTLHD